jgi:hypothetical protein
MASSSRYERNPVNTWQREREEEEDRAQVLTLSKLLTRAVFFAALVALMMWGPWALVPRLLICAGGAVAYMAVRRSTPLQHYM